jgi:hypothetical protein
MLNTRELRLYPQNKIHLANWAHFEKKEIGYSRVQTVVTTTPDPPSFKVGTLLAASQNPKP